MFCIILFLFIFILDLYHLPAHKLNDEEKALILKNGLIHFTTAENVARIMENGFEGQISKMSFMERKMGKMTWFYIFDGKTNKNNFKRIQSKSNVRHSYNCGIKLNSFGEDDFNRMKIRRGFGRDNAIVYISDKIVGHELSVWNADN